MLGPLVRTAHSLKEYNGSCSNLKRYFQFSGRFYKTEERKGKLSIRPSPDSKAPQLRMDKLRKKIGDIMGVDEGIKHLTENRNSLMLMLPKSQDDLPTRSMQDSYDSAILPLGSQVHLRNKYANILGGSRVGRLLEDMDMFAVWVALKHLKNPKQELNKPTPYILVTARVDNISLLAECKANSDIRISGLVTWVGKSSIEVCVWLEQMQHDIWQQFMKAYFIMAARNSNNTDKAFVNKLVPNGEAEIRKYNKAKERLIKRKKEKDESLLKTVPNKEEQILIHELFMKSVDDKDPSLNKRILPPSSAWMDSTKLTTVIFPHPEDKNHHNTVFGGLIMRLAVELGWMVGYVHCKYRPTLRNVSDITFRRPIRIGDFLHMGGQVVYTEGNFVHVVVQAELRDIPTGVTTITNTFQLTYQLPEKVPEVIPLTYHGSMMMIEGRRSFHQFLDQSRSDILDSYRFFS